MRITLPAGILQGKNYFLYQKARPVALLESLPEKKLLSFNRLVNGVNGQSFPANFSFFYPFSPHQYLERMDKLSLETPPLLVFMFLTTACRDRCLGCFAAGYRPERGFYSWQVIERTIQEFGEVGVKAIKFAGRESTISPLLSEALRVTASNGLESVLITGGDNLKPHEKAVIDFVTHFRVSINASNEALHRRIQNPTKRADSYETRINNYKNIIRERKKQELVSGATFLVGPETADDLYATALKTKDIGFDYLRLIYLTHLIEASSERDSLLKIIEEQREQAQQLSDEDFIFWDALEIPELALNEYQWLPPEYWDPSLYIRVSVFADGKVVASPDYIVTDICESSPGVFGNLKQQSFWKIWLGSQRAAFIEEFQRRFEAGQDYEQRKFKDLNQILRFMALQKFFISQRGE